MKRVLSVLTAVAMTATTAHAQTVSHACSNQSTVAIDACQKALDLFSYMAPQFGTSIAGGNATLGQGGTLGGFPHVTVGIRGTVVDGSLPQIDKVPVSYTGAQSSTYPTKTQIIGVPQIDAAVGLFKGLPLGVTNVGGLDLLLSAAYLPSINSSNVDLSVPDGSWKIGYGARLGLLQESIIIPGISLTVIRRGLPTANIHALTNDGDSLEVDGLKLNTTSWRLVANKSLLLFGLAVGVGGDHYTSDATISANVPAQPPLLTEAVTAGPVAAKQTVDRTNYFLDLTFNLAVTKLVAEVGGVSGGKVTTYNQFDGKAPDASRVYGTLGLRFGI